MNINKALRLIRVFNDLKRNELALKLGISLSYISEIEAGVKQPSLKILSAYAECFEIPMSSLMFFCENVEEPYPKTKKFVSNKVLALLEIIAQNSNYANEE